MNTCAWSVYTQILVLNDPQSAYTQSYTRWYEHIRVQHSFVCVCAIVRYLCACMCAREQQRTMCYLWVSVCIILLCALVCVCFFFGMPFQNLFHSIPFRIFLPLLSVFLTILFWSCNDENQQVASHLVCTQQRARTHRAAQFALFIYLVDAAVDAVALVHFLDIFITIIV